MAESIVKVPSTASGDFDFLGFSFAGRHSWDDFHIYRTSDGDRYNENLTPTQADKTAEVPGGDGMYYFGATHKQKDFNISFAFEALTESQLRELKKWLNGKEMGDLWFEEAPYKIWTAKPAGNSSIKYIPFDDKDGERVYRGEGTVQFVAYYPYAHTPDKVVDRNGEHDGNKANAYDEFKNSKQFLPASGITNDKVAAGYNPGDIETPFVLEQEGFIPKGAQFEVGELEFTTEMDCYDLVWDSKTGIVSGKRTQDAENKVIIPVYGKTCGAIPVNKTIEEAPEVYGEAECFTEEYDKEDEQWGDWFQPEETYIKEISPRWMTITDSSKMEEVFNLDVEEAWKEGTIDFLREYNGQAYKNKLYELVKGQTQTIEIATGLVYSEAYIGDLTYVGQHLSEEFITQNTIKENKKNRKSSLLFDKVTHTFDVVTGISNLNLATSDDEERGLYMDYEIAVKIPTTNSNTLQFYNLHTNILLDVGSEWAWELLNCTSNKDIYAKLWLRALSANDGQDGQDKIVLEFYIDCDDLNNKYSISPTGKYEVVLKNLQPILVADINGGINNDNYGILNWREANGRLSGDQEVISSERHNYKIERYNQYTNYFFYSPLGSYVSSEKVATEKRVTDLATGAVEITPQSGDSGDDSIAKTNLKPMTLNYHYWYY